MAVGVVGELVAGRRHVPQDGLHAARRAADDEERRVRVVIREHAQDRRRAARRPVVEGERDHALSRVAVGDAVDQRQRAAQRGERVGQRRQRAHRHVPRRRGLAEGRSGEPPPRPHRAPRPAITSAATTSQNTRRRRRCLQPACAALRADPVEPFPRRCDHALTVPPTAIEASEHAASGVFPAGAIPPSGQRSLRRARRARRPGAGARPRRSASAAAPSRRCAAPRRRPRRRRPRRRRARA